MLGAKMGDVIKGLIQYEEVMPSLNNDTAEEYIISSGHERHICICMKRKKKGIYMSQKFILGSGNEGRRQKAGGRGI